MMHLVLALDPISLTAIGLGISALGAVGGTAASIADRPKTPPAPNIPPTPAPVQQPTGSPTTNAPSGTPSFLAAAAAPQQQNIGGKTLLGQ